MKLQTKYFGEIDYEPAESIRFPAGMFGFDDEHDFLLLPFEGSGHSMLCLQSIATPALAFILLDPFSRRSLRRTYPFSVFHRHAVDVSDPLAHLAERGLPLTKLHGDQKPGGYPLEELAALPGVSLTASNDHDFELVPAGVNKGRTLALLALMWGIPLERCAAVGDSANDLEMLHAVGRPIAMGNAAPQVQAAAACIVADNSHDGAAQAILSCLE